MVVFCQLNADLRWQAVHEEHGKKLGLLLTRLDQLYHLNQKIHGALAAEIVHVEQQLSFLNHRQLVIRKEKCLQLSVAVLRRRGEKVCHAREPKTQGGQRRRG